MSEWQAHSPLSPQAKEAAPPPVEPDSPLMTLSVDVHGYRPEDVHVQWHASSQSQNMDRNRLVRAAIEALRQEAGRVAEA